MLNADQLLQAPRQVYLQTERSTGQAYVQDLDNRVMETGGISLMDILIVMAGRKRRIALATLIAACAGVLIAFLIPARYTATTVLLPPQQGSTSAMLMSQLSSMGTMASAAAGDLGLKNPNDMYVALLKVEPVEEAMVQQFRLKTEYHSETSTDARKAFEKHVDIMNGSKDGLIRIAVTDTNPRRAASMANAYVADYQSFSQKAAISEASQRRVFFAQQLVEAKDNLDNAEVALKKAEQTKGLVQLGGQSMALIQSAASLRAKIAAQQVEIRAMRSYAGNHNADLMLAEQQLAGWQAELGRVTGDPSDSGDRQMLSGNEMPGVQLLYAKKVRDVKYYETIFDLLAKQFEMAKLDEAREGSRIQVMAAATVPDQRSGPPRLLIIIGFILGGFFLASLYTVLVEGFRDLRKDPRHWAQVNELVRQFRRGPA